MYKSPAMCERDICVIQEGRSCASAAPAVCRQLSAVTARTAGSS